MPGPVAAIAGAAIGGVAQAAGARSAARAQTSAARQQRELGERQLDMAQSAYDQQLGILGAARGQAISAQQHVLQGAGGWEAQARDAILGESQDVFDRNNRATQRAFSREAGVASGARDDVMGAAQQGFGREIGAAGGAFGNAMSAAQGTYGAQAGAFGNALMGVLDSAQAGYGREMGAFGGARDAILSSGQAGFGREMGLATDARNIGRADADAALRGQREDLTSALDAALGDLSPFRAHGLNALGAASYEMGLGARPDGFTGLSMSPAARFALEQGRDSIEAGAAGRGGLNSGATLQALEDRRFGLAAMDRETQLDRLLGMGAMGQNAAGQMAALRQNTGANLAAAQGDHRNALLGLESQFADRGTMASQSLTGLQAGAQQGFADRAAGASGALTGAQIGAFDAYGNRMAGAAGDFGAAQTAAGNQFADRFGQASQGLSTAQQNAANAFANRISQASQLQRDAQIASNLGLGQSRANALAGFAGNMLGHQQNYANTVGNAWTNYAAGAGNAAQLFGQGMGSAMQMQANALGNMGNAQAAGRVGMGNAISDSFNNALGGWQMYNMMQAMRPQ